MVSEVALVTVVKCRSEKSYTCRKLKTENWKKKGPKNLGKESSGGWELHVHLYCAYMYVHVHVCREGKGRGLNVCWKEATYCALHGWIRDRGINPVRLHDQSRTCICTRESKQGGKVRQSPKADSEKNTELPRTGFEPVTTGLLVQCSANCATEAAQSAGFKSTVI